MPHAATLLERGTLPPSLSGAIMGVAHCTGDAWIMAAPTTRDSEGLSRGPAGSVIGGLESILFPRFPQTLCSRLRLRQRAFSRQHGHRHRIRAQLRQQHFQPVRRGAGTRAATVVPRVVGLLRLLCLEDHLASAACTKGASPHTAGAGCGPTTRRPPPATLPPHASLALHTHCTVQYYLPHLRPSQWMLPLLLAFFVVSGLYEHSPVPIACVEALAPAVVPAAVAVNVHFWARALTLKRRPHALACFALYIAHMYAGTTEALVDALPSSPAATAC